MSILALTLLSSTLAMFEKEKGLNEWTKEHLGEVKDLKFIENSPHVYTLSTSELLTLFDTDKQSIIWKK
jgi:hypothetical protein